MVRALTIAGAVAMFGGQTLAQNAEPQPTTPVARQGGRVMPTGPDGNAGPSISVDFKGGTAKEFVDAVRSAAGADKVNVIMPREAETVALPAISLNNVGVYTALQAMEFASGSNNGVRFSVSLLGPTEPSRTFAVGQITSFQPGTVGPAGLAGSRQETRVFSLRELVELPAGQGGEGALTSETIINAVRSATQLDSSTGQSAPEIMFHKDSLLLLVRASGEQLRTIEAVLGQLRQSVEARRAQAVEGMRRQQAFAMEQTELRGQMTQAEIQVAQAKQRMVDVQGKLDRFKQMRDKGSGSAGDVESIEAELNVARTTAAQAEATRRGVEERRTLLEQRMKSGGDGAGSSEAIVLVVYQFADLKAFGNDVLTLIRAVVPGAAQDAFTDPVQAKVRATPSQHRVIVTALNTIRRAKANEPQLPGQSVEELIRKSEGK